MQPPEDHLSFNLIADLAEGRFAPSDSARQHLAACGRCAADLAWLERLIALARAAAFDEPPYAVVRRVKALLRERRAPPPGPRLLHAILRFDSALNTPAFGLRADASLERQILLDAEDCVVDLRIAPAGDHVIVTGQILADDRPPAAPASTELLGAGGQASADLNELNEFTLPPVRPGEYTLTISLGDRTILVPGLDLAT